MVFSSVVGHDKQKKIFEQAVNNGKLGHAYALIGPEHIGKTTFASAAADYLGADPILDVFLFDSPEGLDIEQARQLQARLSLTPIGRHKVVIVANAERMKPAAGNALLKTLEEPPAHSVLFLTSVNFHSLLPTVASRVRRINFGAAADEEVKRSIKDTELDVEQSKNIVELAAGKIGLAQRLKKDPQLLDFYKLSREYAGILRTGSIHRRLLTAQTLSSWETEQIADFLKIAMQAAVAEPAGSGLGEKLLAAFRGLSYNLNTKLLLDDLFLP
jgi:DNA polymerase-3 subunit delta'